MRCLDRNKVKFYYALYESKTPLTDDYGNATGEYSIRYGKPIEFYANISAAKGETQTRQFGENESYDKVIIMDHNAPVIDEYAILWIDRMPLLDENGSLKTDDSGEVVTPHDYIVKKVAKSLNVLSLAVSKVKVS